MGSGGCSSFGIIVSSRITLSGGVVVVVVVVFIAVVLVVLVVVVVVAVVPVSSIRPQKAVEMLQLLSIFI